MSDTKAKTQESLLHLFEQRLEKGETLLWAGFPNESYVQGRRGHYYTLKVFLWGIACFILVTLGAIYIPIIFIKFPLAIVAGAVPIIAGFCLFPPGLKYSPWYAFSDRRIFLGRWDDENNKFVVESTGFSNVQKVSLEILEIPSGLDVTGEIGTLSCLCYKTISTRFSRTLTFQAIDSPLQVQALLLEVLAPSQRKYN